ncbi:hypothetical protein OEA41_005701 [Lepraria neglecta]|uniref:Uncharacterized protein n=1 Tax=Lepraria neglecta TaxID=209136 RepID=A0AAD9Z6N0_9LECA|nr:hypothetical protein OEA41_005701 [Lepraria neglecta]
MPSRGPAYTPEESVVLIYSVSRGLTYTTISDIIKFKCGTDRNARSAQSRVAKVREDATGYGWRDFYTLAPNKYDFDLVDQWLRGHVDCATLWTLIAWDGDVEEILRGHGHDPSRFRTSDLDLRVDY